MEQANNQLDRSGKGKLEENIIHNISINNLNIILCRTNRLPQTLNIHRKEANTTPKTSLYSILRKDKRNIMNTPLNNGSMTNGNMVVIKFSTREFAQK
mmetsp:Transcript_3383/g.5422  ORF Transcript_3383/g.5422 Transcript_3383/m.5422 type:complete len:98 (-) Transcript_3383:459-752(-)